MESLQKLINLLLLSLLLSPLSTKSDTPIGCTPHEIDVLHQIKAHFNGVGFSDWTSGIDCCEWSYIGCPSEGPLDGRVTSLIFIPPAGLVGTIPDVIGELTYLHAITFEDEPKLTGPIPYSFTNLTYLDDFRLTSTSVSGIIPDFLGNLKNLDTINISNNHFTGSIPPSLSRLTRLTAFNASQNMLTGSIPSLSNKLTEFDVSNNKLCGEIPKRLQKFNVSAFEHNKCLCGHPLSPCK